MTNNSPSDGPGNQAFRGLSYILLAGGLILIFPFLIIAIFKLTQKAYFSSSILAAILVTGQLILLIPILSIPLSALWVFQRTGDLSERSRVFFQSMLRYAPILILNIAQTIYGLTHDALFLPGILGVMVLIYVTTFMVRDRNDARP